MRRKVFLFSIVLFAIAFLSVTAVFAADMFSGTWKQNLAKSTYRPGPAPKGPSTSKVTAVDNGLKIVNDGVNDKGQKMHLEFTVKFDGKDSPYKATLDGKPNPDAGDMISAKKIDDYTYETTLKLKGKVLTVRKNVVSKDGKTVTATITGTNAQGQTVNNVIVTEKQ